MRTMSDHDKHQKHDKSEKPHHERDPEALEEAVIAADDTGMLSGERLITEAEIREANPDRR
jgi:hypothetical protein